MIDAGLSADGAVYHGKQGGGDIDIIDTAHEYGSGKAAQIAHNAAAEIDDEIVS